MQLCAFVRSVMGRATVWFSFNLRRVAVCLFVTINSRQYVTPYDNTFTDVTATAEQR